LQNQEYVNPVVKQSKDTYRMMKRLAHDKKKIDFSSYVAILKVNTGLSRNNIIDRIKDLEEAGFIKRNSGSIVWCGGKL
jgi:DNA-binding Lrp family transcriptional regulator